MLLQEAIILGDTLKKSNPRTFLSDGDGVCGCAIGGALLATGVTVEEWHADLLRPGISIEEMPCIMSRWPWLTLGHLATISDMYREVAIGRATIEDIAAYVKTIEPVPAAAEPTEQKELVTA
jgi:hypothetical protein